MNSIDQGTLKRLPQPTLSPKRAHTLALSYLELSAGGTLPDPNA